MVTVEPIGPPPETERSPVYTAIITCYYEEQSIDEFHERLSRAFQVVGRPYEIIYVNDGSTDKTFHRLEVLLETDKHVSAVIDLFKNSGQAWAITAGIEIAAGEAFVFMDSDLQLDPEDLPRLISEYEEGHDVVTGYRASRRDGVTRTIPSRIANIIMRRASGANLRDFGCTFRVFHGNLVRAFPLGPYHCFNPVTVISKAHLVKELPVSHHKRKYGKSGWTFARLWQYQMEHLIAVSEKLFQYLGLICLIGAVLFVIRVLVGFVLHWSFLGEVTPGLILNSVFVTFLVLVAVLCFVGELTIRSFFAGQRTPGYIVKRTRRRVDDG